MFFSISASLYPPRRINMLDIRSFYASHKRKIIIQLSGFYFVNIPYK